MKDLTLNQWIEEGGCNFSDYCTYQLCRYNNLSPNQLREMPLDDIFELETIPADWIYEGGSLARRELLRFWKTCPNQLTGSARDFAISCLT